MSMLPTYHDLNVFDSLDEHVACKNFLGKDLKQAEDLFRQNSLYYQCDLLWMGPAAFRFYVQSAINYLKSDAAIADSDFVNGFSSTLTLRLEWAAEELRPVAPLLADACGYILTHYDQFDVDPNIFEDLRPRYQKLQTAFSTMSSH